MPPILEEVGRAYCFQLVCLCVGGEDCWLGMLVTSFER